MNPELEQDQEIDLLEIFRVLTKKWWLILLGGIVGALAAFAVARFLITPTYESSASFYVNNKNQSNLNSQYYSTTDLTAAKSLVETYIVILEQSPTLETVIANCNLPYTAEELKKMIKAEAVNSTEIFSVTVTSTNPIEAQQIVNAIETALPESIAKVVDGAAVEIVASGKLNPEQVAPSYKKFALIGFLIGLILVIVIVLIKYFTDNKVHDENFVKKISGEHPLLGIIPDLESGTGKKHGYGYGYGYGYEQSAKGKDRAQRDVKGEDRHLCANLSFHAAEAYKLLRTNVLYALTDKEGCTVFGITSSLRGEAKSTTSINLAYTFAETGKKVLLIEADMRLPVMAGRLHLKAKPGLSNIIAGFSGVKEALQPVKLGNNWYVITAGDVPPNPAELLESKQMEKMLEMFRHTFDHIIIDLPPVNVVSDALAVAPYMDGLILVAREEYTDVPAVMDAVQKIEFSEGNLLGYVLTGSAIAEKTKYRGVGFNKRGKGYGYGYGYDYGYDRSQATGKEKKKK